MSVCVSYLSILFIFLIHFIQFYAIPIIIVTYCLFLCSYLFVGKLNLIGWCEVDQVWIIMKRNHLFITLDELCLQFWGLFVGVCFGFLLFPCFTIIPFWSHFGDQKLNAEHFSIDNFSQVFFFFLEKDQAFEILSTIRNILFILFFCIYKKTEREHLTIILLCNENNDNAI